jgi:hypothetical protein
VLNSSYISQRILFKLSQKLCHHAPWHILSGFCDWIIFDLIMALCFFPYREYIVNTSSVAIPPTLFMFYIVHSYIVYCLYLYFKYNINIFIYNGDNWKPGFMALPCFLFTIIPSTIVIIWCATWLFNTLTFSNNKIVFYLRVDEKMAQVGAFSRCAMT